MKTIKEVYQNHAEMPYIAPAYQEELLRKPIPKRNMERTKEGLLPGHIVMLWRIQFGTYTTANSHHKYFYTTYGIDAQTELDWLISQGYVQKDSARESLRHLPASRLKDFLGQKAVKGLSKIKRDELDQAVLSHFSEEELSILVDLRGYRLLPKGEEALGANANIVDRHPQKKY
ncbi:Uncharacterised protein [Streptococcus dysgalactiae subsp. dysgalactiae]|uniref:Uncharacterized protein n=1 Tax=Streptococcus dysgalactiae subsp. dysgalactiae TaxID=99822 RepID=A0A380JST5_STRDY|nr:hypothetical protein [Streptococcus dysgalactiae]SUN48506.1 Uncharacterised protein [Streptococcus dysgalactiae subsp. dysgalactiae]